MIQVVTMNEKPSSLEGFFPDDIIPTDQKDYNWHLQWCKAAWLEYTSLERGSMWLARDRYSYIQAYLQGRQPIDQYKDQMAIDDSFEDPWIALNWEPLKWLAGLRDIAIAKVSKRDYSIECVPIDSLAQDEMKQALSNMQGRLEIRKQMKKLGVDVDVTQFAREEGEPEDDLEMEIIRRYTFKHNMAMQAEQAIDVVLNGNKYNRTRQKLKEDLFAYGVCGVKDFIDSAGNARVRRVEPSRSMTSPGEDPDYKDIRYAGEIRRMTIASLIEDCDDVFTQEQYVDIARNYTNKYGNPIPMSDEDIYSNYRDYKIDVLDLEWFSVNSYTWEKRVNRYDNTIIGMVDPRKMREGQDYIRKNFKVVYKASWVVGSDYAYNWGLSTNMKRKRTSMQETVMSYNFRAIDFFKNIIVSPAERMTVYVDQLQLLWMKFQYITEQIRADGVAIEIGAIEDIAIGEEGENFEPLEVLDLWHQKGVLYYRRMDMHGNPLNYEPIRELKSDNSVKLQNIWNQILNTMNIMKQQIGFNELTAGTTYDPRALKSAVAAAQESTYDALWKIIAADRDLFEDVADNVLMDVQQIMRKSGNVGGYTTALGTDTVTWFQASPDLALHDFGFVINDIPTDEEKSRLIEEAKQFVAADMLQLEDLNLIKTSRNLKQSQAILAMKVEQRRRQKVEESERQITMNGQVQQQSAMVAAQAEQQTEQLKHQNKMAQINLEKEWDYKIEQLKLSGRVGEKAVEAQASLVRTGITTESKEEVARQQQAQAVSTETKPAQ